MERYNRKTSIIANDMHQKINRRNVTENTKRMREKKGTFYHIISSNNFSIVLIEKSETNF